MNIIPLGVILTNSFYYLKPTITEQNQIGIAADVFLNTLTHNNMAEALACEVVGTLHAID
jgi:hypothetical protein